METNNQPNNPKMPKWVTSKVLWSVIGVLLLVVIVGSVYWYKEIKKTQQSSQFVGDQTATIQGIDADNNGIRDDIQQYIQTKYANQPDMILVLDAYAKAEQTFLLNASDKNQTVKNDAQREKASECLVSMKGDQGWNIRDDIRAHILNTAARSLAYEQADNKLSGMIFTPPPIAQWGELCKEILNPTPTTSTTVDTSTWKIYTNSQYGFSFEYPSKWTDAGRSIDIKNFFTAPPEVEVLDVDTLKETGNPIDVAQKEIKANNCPGDAYIPKGESNVNAMYVLYCSATTEDYIDIIKYSPEMYIRLDYHDDFDENADQNTKLTTLNQIVSTFKFTGSTNAVDTSTLRTYTNSQYGFSIKTPTDWTVAVNVKDGSLEFTSSQRSLGMIQNQANCSGAGNRANCNPDGVFPWDIMFSNKDQVSGYPNTTSQMINGIQFKVYIDPGFDPDIYQTNYNEKIYSFSLFNKQAGLTILSTFQFTK